MVKWATKSKEIIFIFVNWIFVVNGAFLSFSHFLVVHFVVNLLALQFHSSYLSGRENLVRLRFEVSDSSLEDLVPVVKMFRAHADFVLDDSFCSDLSLRRDPMRVHAENKLKKN